MKSYKLILFVVVVFFLFLQLENKLSGRSKRNNFNKEFFIPVTVKNKIQSGDIILRNGKGFISDVFRQFSLKDKSYSHAGIISIEGNKIFVYHILGAETQESEAGKMDCEPLRKESLESFCNSKENNVYAVYRYDLSKKENEKIIASLQSLFEKKIKFDSHFDLTTDSAMYCTELVYKVVEAASEDEEYIPFTIVDGNKYIAPDNLYLNPHAALIYLHKH